MNELVDMAKNIRHGHIKTGGAHYLILVGVVILLIGFVLAVFARQAAAGIVILLIGILVCVIGLSRHSLHMLKRRSGRNRL